MTFEELVEHAQKALEESGLTVEDLREELRKLRESYNVEKDDENE